PATTTRGGCSLGRLIWPPNNGKPEQIVAQWPSVQPFRQTCPHIPQLFGSCARSTPAQPAPLSSPLPSPPPSPCPACELPQATATTNTIRGPPMVPSSQIRAVQPREQAA